MQLISDQNYLTDNIYIQLFYNLTGSKTYHEFIIIFGVLLITLITSISLFTFICRWIIFKFTWKSFSIVQKKLMSSYLSKNYEFFLSRDVSELSKNILTEVGISVNGFLYPFVDAISKLISFLFILTIMAYIEPLKTFYLILLISIIYGLISAFSGKLSKRFGSQRLVVHENLYKSTIETFGVFKLIKAKGLEKTFINNFSIPANKYANLNLWVSILGIFPKYILEASFLCSAILFVLYEIKIHNDLTKSLPVISLFAFSSIKILPYLQQVYANLMKCLYNLPSVIKLELDCTHSIKKNINDDINFRDYKFTSSLFFEDISFGFTRDLYILNKINFTLKKNTFNVICGKTGCGKSTLIDIMIGLISPISGSIYSDGNKLTMDEFSKLRTCIGFVPQHTVLLNSSIRENIAFGVDKLHIDDAKITKIANLVQISHLIKNDFHIGEGGLKLSGGERQRVGIARALYDNPQILILDESTSAMDSLTEKKILGRLRKLPEITIIMITHRMESLNPNDYVYYLENGIIKLHGKYSELINYNSAFQFFCQKNLN